MGAQKRKIVVILDNCLAHPHVPDLAHVSLIFLPPNTTPLTQPMDGGIINSTDHTHTCSILSMTVNFNDNFLLL